MIRYFIPTDKILSQVRNNEDKDPERTGTMEKRLNLKWNCPGLAHVLRGTGRYVSTFEKWRHINFPEILSRSLEVG